MGCSGYGVFSKEKGVPAHPPPPQQKSFKIQVKNCECQGYLIRLKNNFSFNNLMLKMWGIIFGWDLTTPGT